MLRRLSALPANLPDLELQLTLRSQVSPSGRPPKDYCAGHVDSLFERASCAGRKVEYDDD